MFGVVSESNNAYACMIFSLGSFHACLAVIQNNYRHHESKSDHDTAWGVGGVGRF